MGRGVDGLVDGRGYSLSARAQDALDALEDQRTQAAMDGRRIRARTAGQESVATAISQATSAMMEGRMGMKKASTEGAQRPSMDSQYAEQCEKGPMDQYKKKVRGDVNAKKLSGDTMVPLAESLGTVDNQTSRFLAHMNNRLMRLHEKIFYTIRALGPEPDEPTDMLEKAMLAGNSLLATVERSLMTLTAIESSFNTRMDDIEEYFELLSRIIGEVPPDRDG